MGLFRVQVQQPDVGSTLVRFHVRLAQDVRDVAAVGRQLRIVEPFEANQILHGERRIAVRGGARRGCGHDRGGCGHDRGGGAGAYREGRG